MIDTRTYPHKSQPAGIQRTDDPILDLSPAETKFPLRRLILGLGYHYYRAALPGRNWPVPAEAAERVCHPQPGDLVMAIDHALRPTDRLEAETIAHSLGYLVAHRKEWLHTDKEWLTVPEGEDPADRWATPYLEWTDDPDYAGDKLTHPKRPTDTVYYIQYGPDPADVCRWADATIIAIPTDVRGTMWGIDLLGHQTRSTP